MKISETSRLELQEFFRLYFKDETISIPPIYFYGGTFSAFVTRRLKIHGITLDNIILLAPEIMRCEEHSGCFYAPENLVAHELTHVVQYQKQGIVGFLYRYLRDYFSYLRKNGLSAEARLQAYYSIAQEVEARDAAEAYEFWRAEKRRRQSET